MSMNHFLWVEKYRPADVSSCVLPPRLEQTFQDMVETKQIPNLILTGGAGCGKTTVARALCRQLGLDMLFINASEESGIDVLRTKIRNFASTVSLNGGIKVVILDEADYLNPSSTQPALRGFMEEFAANCRFILTCNFKNRIIEPLHSRCTVLDFRVLPKERPTVAAKFHSRVRDVLKAEGIEYSDKVVAELVMKNFPDFRKTINELQKYSRWSKNGKIDAGVLVGQGDSNVSVLVKCLKSRNFTDIRKWVVDNSDKDMAYIFRSIYDGVQEHLTPDSIPQAVLILAEFQYKSAFAADQEINLTACCISLASDCTFKT
jgi:DNA polymerase III delta prime subunit